MNLKTPGLALSAWMLLAQPSFAQMPAQRFFPKANLMEVGVYYYPEQWPREQWSRDLQNIARLGFSFTHYAEFAWTYLEPTEGQFDFGWLDDAIALAHDAGLKVILCTPSAAPPAWMTEAHPEILLEGADGRRLQHGARANGSLSNPRFLARASFCIIEEAHVALGLPITATIFMRAASFQKEMKSTARGGACQIRS